MRAGSSYIEKQARQLIVIKLNHHLERLVFCHHPSSARFAALEIALVGAQLNSLDTARARHLKKRVAIAPDLIDSLQNA